ncbi:MAG: hypothetical protein HEQ22_08975 [Sphingopyxis sp.]|uniref:hypothetical protein n=1 Tax=Sphingopyxis sp. TaxID=1908224 RepID=UPI003D81225E
MTKKTDKITDAGAVELSEDALDQASGGAAYIKFDGVDGETVAKPHFKIEIEGLKATAPSRDHKF